MIVVDWFKVLRGTGTVGEDANRLHFLTPNFCRVGEGELVILERRISSRACNSIEVTK